METRKIWEEKRKSERLVNRPNRTLVSVREKKVLQET